MWLDHITSSGLDLDNTSTVRPEKQTRYVPPDSPMANRSLVCAEAPRRERARNLNPPRPATLHPLPGDHSGVAPPDPFPNSEVKRTRADGSVAQAMQE